MQMFILDEDPGRAAGMLCDVHLRKMCLETAQILSSVLFLQGRKLTEGMPRCYNPRHPVIQAINTPQKICWTVECNEALHREYVFRFGRKHAYWDLCPKYRQLLWCSDITWRREDLSFARSFKGIKITEPDIIFAYRAYYRFKKKHLRHWTYTNTAEPDWLKEKTAV